jgi:hypothetical protein
MLSTLDVYDTPVTVSLSLSHGKTMASMTWPHDSNNTSNVLCQTKLDSNGNLTASVTAICPGFGQGLLQLFAKDDKEGAENECLCVFLVRNSGNLPGRRNVKIYSSGYDIVYASLMS